MEIADIQITGDTTHIFEMTPTPWQMVLGLADTHCQLDKDESAMDVVKRYVEYGLENGALFLGLGDYIEIARTTVRRTSSNLDYDPVADAMEEASYQAERKYLHAVDGTQGKWLGKISGNHYWEYRDGTTSDTRIAAKLQAPYLGSCAFIRLRFKQGSTKNLPYTFWVHHGKGGGLTASGGLLLLERIMASFEADCYITAHRHQSVSAPKPRIYMNNKSIVSKDKRLIGLGGYLKGYQAGRKRGNRPEGGYVEKGLLLPVSILQKPVY